MDTLAPTTPSSRITDVGSALLNADARVGTDLFVHYCGCVSEIWLQVGAGNSAEGAAVGGRLKIILVCGGEKERENVPGDIAVAVDVVVVVADGKFLVSIFVVMVPVR